MVSGLQAATDHLAKGAAQVVKKNGGDVVIATLGGVVTSPSYHGGRCLAKIAQDN